LPNIPLNKQSLFFQLNIDGFVVVVESIYTSILSLMNF